MYEMIQFVQYRDWLHLFKTPMPTIYEDEFKDFFFIIESVEDGLSLTSVVYGIDIFLYEISHIEMMNIPIDGIRSVRDQQSTLPIIQSISNVSGNYKAGVRKSS